MIRALISLGLHLAANAIGLLVADWILDGVTIDWSAFVIAVAIFTVVEVIAQPFFTSLAMKSASFLVGGTALVTTFVGLLITSWVSDGLQIEGVTDWIIATLIVWLGALLAGLVLPAIFLKKAVDTAKE